MKDESDGGFKPQLICTPKFLEGASHPFFFRTRGKEFALHPSSLIPHPFVGETAYFLGASSALGSICFTSSSGRKPGRLDPAGKSCGSRTPLGR